MRGSITAQFRHDLSVARKVWLPWRTLLPAGLLSFAVIIGCDHFGRLNMSLPLLNTLAVFGLIMYVKWELRRQPLFWLTMLSLAAIHAILLWVIPWTSEWVPAVAIAGISSVDFLLMLWLTVAVEALAQVR